jgi:predicted HTH transcriptional regulator
MKYNSESIACPFFLAGYIESRGRGIQKIIYELEKFNGVTPFLSGDKTRYREILRCKANLI